ncbi:MAG: 30S ribosomal protein S11 [Nitrospirae bacterium]|nr:30S ribosomal protein S11 [Nitrospirota bacterium]
MIGNKIIFGNVTIHSLPDNTVITFYDKKGKVVSWSSTLTQGYHGEIIDSLHAVRQAARHAAETAIGETGVHEVDLHVKQESNAEKQVADLVIRAAIDAFTFSGLTINMVIEGRMVKIKPQQMKAVERDTLGKLITRFKEWWRSFWR